MVMISGCNKQLSDVEMKKVPQRLLTLARFPVAYLAAAVRTLFFRADGEKSNRSKKFSGIQESQGKK